MISIFCCVIGEVTRPDAGSLVEETRGQHEVVRRSAAREKTEVALVRSLPDA